MCLSQFGLCGASESSLPVADVVHLVNPVVNSSAPQF